MKIIDRKDLEIKPGISNEKILKRKTEDKKSDHLNDFTSMIKPWGFEYLCFRDKNFDIWELSINPSCSTSSHLHTLKEVFVLVLTGSINLHTTHKNEVLNRGDFRIIKCNTIHQFVNTTKNIARILEIESPPNRHDIVRVKDNYGRNGLPYLINKKEMNTTRNDFFFKKIMHKSDHCDIFNLTQKAKKNTNPATQLIIYGAIFKKKITESDGEIEQINIKTFFVISGNISVLTPVFGKKTIKEGQCFVNNYSKILSIKKNTTIIYWV